jgi:hypothetical protein
MGNIFENKQLLSGQCFAKGKNNKYTFLFNLLFVLGLVVVTNEPLQLGM